MAEDTTWGRVKRGVKGFFSGMMRSAPITLMTSAATLGLSYTLGTYVSPDLDLLRVAGSTGPQFATRILGGFIIGTTINGTIDGFRALSTPEGASAPQSAAAPARSRDTGGHAHGHSLSLTPPSTPLQPRGQQRPHFM